MNVFTTVAELRNFLDSNESGSLGFVPTMGALHAGHRSLVARAVAENELTIASIFVNPTQFNEESDLTSYPSTPRQDYALLREAGCDLVFHPTVSEVYPKSGLPEPDYQPGYLAETLEGAHRPGHFAGVVQVVHRLLDIVRPERLYMGQKDYQQAAIIADMIRSLELPVELRVCPTVREQDGLAMSSRNVRLSPDIRRRAVRLFETLTKVRQTIDTLPPEAQEQLALWQLADADFRPEYFRIVDGATLRPLNEYSSTEHAVACTAVWAGGVRLIDNMILKSPGPDI